MIRRVEATDGKVVRDLRLEALRESPDAFGASYEEEVALPVSHFDSFVSERAVSDKDAFFVALKTGSVVGMVGAFFDNASGEPYVCSMWVTPQHRRGRIGLGLLREAVGWLESQGAQHANAWVTCSNSKAIAFYESAGFQATDTVQKLPSNHALQERLYVRMASAA